jgi:hypothetical protein
MLVLQVEDPGHRLGGRGQLRVLERMRDPLAVQPDLAGIAAQAVQELGSSPGGDLGLRFGGSGHDGTSSGGSGWPSISRLSRS